MNNKSYNELQYATMRTSFLTAFPKIFTDIEFSTEIFSKMKELAMQEGFSFLPNYFTNGNAVEIEARHKALNIAFEKEVTEDTLVIEIAAGLSPRHLQYRNYDYYELDYNPIINIKKKIYSTMGYEFLNSSLYGLDITDVNVLQNCINEIINLKKHSKIIILNEGLFWYLTKEQIKDITNVFINSISKTDWMWITADCPPVYNNDMYYRNIITSSAKLEKEKTFIDYDDFSNFFAGIGLMNIRNKYSDFMKYKDLSSAKFLSFGEEETIKKINSYADIAKLYLKRSN